MKDYCLKCGKEIMHYEQTEQVGNELIITYHCNVCGFHGEQHYTLNYTHTVDLEAEAQREKRQKALNTLNEVRNQTSQDMKELVAKYSKVYGEGAAADAK